MLGDQPGASGGPPPNAPHVLFVVNADWYFASHRLELASYLLDAGWRVSVATQDTGVAGALAAAGCAVYRLGWRRRGLAPADDVRVLWQLRALVRRLRPDLVHPVALKAIVVGGLAVPARGGPPAVHAVAGLGYAFTGGGAHRRALRAAVRAGLRRVLRRPRTRVIVQNPDDGALLVAEGVARAEDVVLIPGAGVDVTRFPPAPPPADGPPLVVLPARMLWDKGVAEFVEAATRLRAAAVPVRLALVGGFDPENSAAVPRAQLEAWRATGPVEWWGHRPDMPAVLRHAAVVALPSYREGLPKALLEGAAAGRPLIATDVPGCRDVVRHDCEGLLIPPRDPGALADAIARLAGDPALRVRLGAGARARAEREFAAPLIHAATLDVYRALLGPAWAEGCGMRPGSPAPGRPTRAVAPG